jgi:hypothetical protein
MNNMKKNLLSLFIFYNILHYDIKLFISNILLRVRTSIKRFIVSCKNIIKKSLVFLGKLTKIIIKPFRKMLYEYVVITFFACLVLNFKFKTWPYIDYIWGLFFVVLMSTLLVVAIKDK